MFVIENASYHNCKSTNCRYVKNCKLKFDSLRYKVYSLLMTIEEIKDKILDDQELVTDRSYFKRDYSLLPREGFAIVLTGTRRSGKSSLLRLYAQNLIKEGVGQNRICYLSFFDSSFPANECRIDQIAKAFYSLYPASMKETVYFLLDEVQKLDKWGEGVSRLMDKYDCRVIVTGSSAKFLSTDIATELRGRSISKKFFPLSFFEDEFRKRLQTLLEEIFSENEPFTQTEDIKKCSYCDFKAICKR